MSVRRRVYDIVFESDTRMGKLFDVVLLWLILLSVLTVIAESIPWLEEDYRKFFFYLEWVFTILFTLEYLLRIIVSPKPLHYIRSFWGVVDLLAILPGFISIFYAGYQSLMVVRFFRLLRLFRILKLARFSREAQYLFTALQGSFFKIGVFLFGVAASILTIGALMYVVEGGKNGFGSIPESLYWAVVTITTVGYGDIVPQTALGKVLASFCMLLGYAIIAVPTGIVTVAMSKAKEEYKICENCGKRNDPEGSYCSRCGTELNVTGTGLAE